MENIFLKGINISSSEILSKAEQKNILGGVGSWSQLKFRCQTDDDCAVGPSLYTVCKPEGSTDGDPNNPAGFCYAWYDPDDQFSTPWSRP